jgi:1-acyl-sn-glycerol-3-phosphate acyltransferase
MQTYSVPFGNRLFRRSFRPIFRLLFHLLGGVKVTGRHNVPIGKPYIITMNHVSLYEAPFLVAFWPVAPEIAGAIEIWSRPGQNLLARGYYGIPVHRGEYDRQALDTMIEALKSGRPLLLAPEGGRSHAIGMRRAFPGVAYLVDKINVPVIPVGIVGTTEDYFTQAIRMKRPALEMHIGKPLYLPPIPAGGPARRQALQVNADLIMREIALLLPPEYRGVYDPASNAYERES